ncbi:cupin-like domain-containing protein [Simiduia aestuariiviva]|uniref:JmjC domain-containing protein n=1 Tax=Simiduia aestuariiviva TaxID=1510459 RepID=A0A839UH47_9GAMM|nr:cupin-like domain-containing protein [Simiduia aestuariiviva]MBB3167364.1 hypothetical protein [Simiduia aestuariiviva]
MTELPAPKAIRAVEGCSASAIPDHVLQSREPLVLKGLVKTWPATALCSESISSAATYLAKFWTQLPVTAYVSEPGSETRLFYNEDCTGFNFRRGTAPLHQVLQKLSEHSSDAEPPVIYVGSTMVDKFLPGFRADNDLALGDLQPLMSMWIGNKSRISAHYDFPDNIACVVAGRRRFTLFPPDQLSNLYIGPVDRTPAGQAISLVDFSAPDLTHFPRFAEAMKHAQAAELEPGDAVFIPSMWWHHVESLSNFNILVNYWWTSSPDYLGAPSAALMHAMLALRDLPAHQKAIWAQLFDHYVFNSDQQSLDHIPEAGRGVLSNISKEMAAWMRSDLINKLK